MFSPRTRPLALDAERLLGLRLSLNTPVVATAELPPGPARAALVSHLDNGLRHITVAVRSLRNGATVLYDLEGMDLDATLEFGVAVDASLSFAESMGFLFDDDEVGKGGDDPVGRALRRWRETMGPGAGRVAVAEAPAVARSRPGPPDGTGELVLEDVAESLPAFDLSPGADLFDDEPLPPPASPRPGAPGTLTKFRGGTEPPPAPDDPETPDPGATALGRVQLVRRSASTRSGRASPLLRLLAWF